MPINLSDYPSNWKEISTRTRKAREYICEYCLKGRIRKNPFTVHHKDHDPMHNEDINLALLHASCHLLFHSTYRSCRLPSEFKEICRNHQSQMKFWFDKQFEDQETGGKFIQYKIKQKWRKQQCLKNSLAENCLSSLSRVSQTSSLSLVPFHQKLKIYSLNLSLHLARSTSQLKA